MAVKGRQVFRQLVEVDDDVDVKALQRKIDEHEITGIEYTEIKGQLDIYEESLEKKYVKNFFSLIAIMNRVAGLQAVPKEKFRDVTSAKGKVTEYEYKVEDLRVWGIKCPNGQIIVYGGYKNNQEDGFKRFRGLVVKYLNNQ